MYALLTEIKQLDIASNRYKKHKENELYSDSIAALDNVELDRIEATGTPAAGATVAKNVLNEVLI